MKVKFRTNLGSKQAGMFGLDHTKCECGSEATVPDHIADALSARGLAVVIHEKKIKAVPKQPEIGKSKDSE